MNWEHLQAFLWLRWRIAANQWRRGGAFNAILMSIIAISAVVVSIPLTIGTFFLGVFLIPRAEPLHLMFAWDGLVAGLIFFWMIGLITELQRTETLSLSKFLHLPVSLKSAFLINYVSSLVRLSMLLFVPIMLGFAVALIFADGPRMLPVLPALAAFLLMVTGVTYQFQGWLASLMSNPRRRRTVIFGLTAVFVLIAQVPNLINFMRPWGSFAGVQDSNSLVEEFRVLEQKHQAQELTAQEYVRLQNEAIERHRVAREEANRRRMDSVGQTVRLVNLALPIGWLPLGVAAAAEGNMLPSILGCLGMGTIGGASLWRAYWTTMRLYQGAYTAGKQAPAPKLAAPSRPRARRDLLVESRIPGVSEPVAAIALAGFRSLSRAPEAKMMLLTPLIVGLMFGSALVRGGDQLPIPYRPLVGLGGITIILFGLLQIMVNQFGFDRDGFRVFVLCAASRRDILLGKNLSYVPIMLGLGGTVLTLIQILCPMRIDHLLAMPWQLISMYLLFCPLANLVAIYAPVTISAGSLKPANPKLVPILLQMVMIFGIFPLILVPMTVPIGAEILLDQLDWRFGAPVCLLLSIVECGVIVLFYRVCLKWEGDLLQAREKRILEAVTNRAP